MKIGLFSLTRGRHWYPPRFSTACPSAEQFRTAKSVAPQVHLQAMAVEMIYGSSTIQAFTLHSAGVRQMGAFGLLAEHGFAPVCFLTLPWSL